MSEANVFLLKDHYRIVGTDGRISGNWHVLLDDRRGTAWVTPHDVTIYDESRHSGIVLRGDAFTAHVSDSGASWSARGHRFEADIDEVAGEMALLLPRIAVVAWSDQRATRSGGSVATTPPLVERDPACVERWPECHSFGYDPRCCRFPKSCSADIVPPPGGSEP